MSLKRCCGEERVRQPFPVRLPPQQLAQQQHSLCQSEPHSIIDKQLLHFTLWSARQDDPVGHWRFRSARRVFARVVQRWRHWDGSSGRSTRTTIHSSAVESSRFCSSCTTSCSPSSDLSQSNHHLHSDLFVLFVTFTSHHTYTHTFCFYCRGNHRERKHNMNHNCVIVLAFLCCCILVVGWVDGRITGQNGGRRVIRWWSGHGSTTGDSLWKFVDGIFIAVIVCGGQLRRASVQPIFVVGFTP